MRHRDNLEMLTARTTSTREGNVTMMHSHNGDRKSRNLRVNSGGSISRSSAISNRSLDSSRKMANKGRINQAVNGIYDRNMGKKYERFR